MRVFLPFLLLTFFTLNTKAQKGTSVQEIFDDTQSNLEYRIDHWGDSNPLIKAQTLVPGWSLVLKKQINSPGGSHWHYQLRKNERFLDNQLLSIHLFTNGNLLIQYPNIHSKAITVSSLQIDTAALKSELHCTRSEFEPAYLSTKSGILTGYSGNLFGPEGLHLKTFIAGSKIHYLEDQRRHFRGSDSTCYTFIFLPDPLSTANVNYGGAFSDNNDGDNSSLNGERKLMSFTATYDSGQFILENADIKIDDFSAPNVAPATSSSSTFNFTRSQDGFEDVNAFFHLTTFKNHINALGYTNLPGNKISVDVHALSNSDQSYYSPSELKIYMGEGGVDDAEDADVIVHEYVHSLVFGASANSGRISERSGMEEAICDYFAVSHSLEYSPNQRDRVFNWDGHNSFWPGRMASSTKDYQTLTFSNNIYQHTDLMASCLLEIHDNTNRSIADALVLEALFTLLNTSTYEDFAHMVIQADLVLNAGQNYQVIKDAFVRRNVLSADFSIDELGTTSKSIKLYNTLAFAKDRSPLFLESEATLDSYELLDLQGRSILRNRLQGKRAQIELSDLDFGIYILKVRTASGQSQEFKIQAL